MKEEEFVIRLQIHLTLDWFQTKPRSLHKYTVKVIFLVIGSVNVVMLAYKKVRSAETSCCYFPST